MSAQEAVNVVRTSSGKVRAVCEFCGRQTRPVTPDPYRDEPGLFDLGRGWSMAPYPKTFTHPDGSTGSQYSCPDCNARFDRGESLRSRREPRRVA
jgi:hypothetical protein